MKLQRTNPELFFSRQDPEDPRLGEFVTESSHETPLCLWGYPDDEGIRKNGGRPGAAEAPAMIRRALYRMTPSRIWPRSPLILDRGDYLPNGTNLVERSDFLSHAVHDQLKNHKQFLVTLGGGHDYGYPDACGFLEATMTADGPKPVVLNFDAHLDVRPLDRGLTSGTPFRRLLENYYGRFDFYEIGILPHCNSPFHWDWAESQGAVILGRENMQGKGLKTSLEENIDYTPEKKAPLWISLDIDCISVAEAPGCSAPNPFGFNCAELMEIWPWLFANFDVRGLGIYEVSPPLDLDQRTSRLAAFMIHASLHELFKQEKPA